ncbi:hypothetical protein [Bdellovibrio sp. NC01]|uniref:hypothetical protein n=1 Tax=Bdellovibrio sp. NC01 TaxID=2220073 RepID=UPI00115B4217|nr:hypothetical protein [Bdellovibrio sp. NC01]QDK37022.1 hypothetical protein DOE51_05140 [Bdellovibrio sp. NC01]
MSHYSVLLPSLLTLMIGTSAHAAASPEAGSTSSNETYKQTGPQSMEVASTVEAEAKVISVDKKKRTIKVRDENGEELTMNVGPDIRNFDQIKKGDSIHVSYIESLAWELKKGSDAPITVTESSDIERAAPGQKPGGLVRNKVTATGVVTAVDKDKKHVTVKGPRRSVVLQVPKTEVLNKIKVGDKVEATYTEALAISIKPEVK